MTTALVTGASGMLGSHMVERLLAAGVEVRAFVRPNSDIHFLQTLPVDIVYANSGNQATLLKAVSGSQLVFHVAGKHDLLSTFSAGNDNKDLLQDNVDLTEAILAASDQAGVARFIFVSSTSVYRLHAHSPIAEDAPKEPCSDYGYSKLLAEERVWAYQRRGLATTIIRPCVIYGPRDRHFFPLALSLARVPLTLMINGGSHLQDLVYVGDVVDLMWLASQSQTAIGKVYNAASGNPQSMRAILSALRNRVRKPTLEISISSQTILRYSRLARWYMRRCAPSIEAIVTPIGISYLSRDVFYDISQARKDLGYSPKVKFEQGLDLTLATIRDKELA